LIGLMCAGVFCSNYAFIYLFRANAQKKYPELAGRWANDGGAALVGMFGTENLQEELSYAAMVQEASEHALAFDPYIKENKSTRLLLIDFLTYKLMAPVHLLTGNMQLTWFLLRFLCCVFWFVLIYRLSRRLGMAEDLSVFCGVFVTCFSYLLTFLFVYNLKFSGGVGTVIGKNIWTLMSYGRTESVLRLPRPGVTYAFLFLVVLAGIRAFTHPNKKRIVLSGVLGGLTAYVRLDIWSIYVVAISIYAVAASYRRKTIAVGLVASAAIAGVVSLPWFLSNYPPDPFILSQSGAVFGRYFNLFSLPHLLAGGYALAFRRDAAGRFFGAILLGTGVMLNVQLITGYELHPDHWKFIGNIFLFLLLISHIPARWQSRARLWQGLSACALLVVFFQGAVYSAINYPLHGLPKDYEEAMAWLKNNTEPESVVVSLNPEINYLVAVFTHNKVLMAAGFTQVSDISREEQARRLLWGAHHLGVDLDKFLKENVLRGPEQYINIRDFKNRGEVEKAVFQDAHFIMFDREEAFELIKRLKTSAQESAFEADYVWAGNYLRDYVGQSFPAQAPWRLKEIHRNPSVTLYKIIKPTAEGGS
jgi:hypothetical protein